MKLYYTPGACSMSPHIVASEAGVPLELEKVNLKEHKTEGGADFYGINPKGYIPALKLDDGSLLTEGAAIVQYLADSKPGSGLLAPVGNPDRYKVIEWLTFTNGELHKSFTPLFQGASDDVKAGATAMLKKRFDTVSSELGDKEYLMGSKFSAADGYMYVVLRWARAMKVAVPANLEKYAARVEARPAVQAVLKAEGLAG